MAVTNTKPKFLLNNVIKPFTKSVRPLKNIASSIMDKDFRGKSNCKYLLRLKEPTKIKAFGIYHHNVSKMIIETIKHRKPVTIYEGVPKNIDVVSFREIKVDHVIVRFFSTDNKEVIISNLFVGELLELPGEGEIIPGTLNSFEISFYSHKGRPEPLDRSEETIYCVDLHKGPLVCCKEKYTIYTEREEELTFKYYFKYYYQ